MKNQLLSLFCLFLCATAVSAQTTLNPGDIAITEIKLEDQLDDPSSNDEVSLVLLLDCVAGTKFVVTDDEVSGGVLTTNEGRIEITLGAAASCGTEINLSGQRRTNIDFLWTVTGGGSPSISGEDPEKMNLTAVGESIIVFQDANFNTTNPARYLTAVNNSGEGFGPQSGGATGTTELPPGLTLGVNAFALPPDTANGDEYDNVYYNCGVITGTPGVLSSSINNANNWTLGNSAANVFTSCGFSCQTNCTNPTLSSLTVNYPGGSCPGFTANITINGTLNDAASWRIYNNGSCTGAFVTTTNPTFQRIIGSDSTYSVTALDCSGTAIQCRSVNVTPQVQPNNAGPDQLLTTYPATLGANPLSGTRWVVIAGDASGMISDLSDPNATFSGTPGVAYTLRWQTFSGGCTGNPDDVVISSFAANNALAAGDVLFTMMNTDDDDAFAFVVLTDIDAGTVFTVTDDEFRNGVLETEEGAINITFTSNVECGSEFLVTSPNNDGNYEGSIVSGTGSVSVATVRAGMTMTIVGESLIAYQGSNYLAALLNCGEEFGNTDPQCTDLPPGLTEGVNALAYDVNIPDGPNNIKYDCSLSAQEEAQLRTAITTQSNWLANNGTAYNYGAGCSFACNVPPTAVCQDITVEIDANGNPTTNGQPFQASDLNNGSSDPDGSIDPNGFSVDITPSCANVTIPISATTITLTVTDNLGTTATCTSQVTVEDNIAPTFDCTNIAVALDANGEYFISNSDVFTRMVQNWSDNCSAAPVNFGSGTRTITCANIINGTFAYRFGALDGNGQETTCTSIITVTDPTFACNTPPLAVCQDITVEIDADGNPTTNGQPFTAADLDGGSNDPGGSIDPNGFSVNITPACADVTNPTSATTITLTVTDNLGSTATCTSQVTVEDNIAPVITCQNVAVDLLADGTFNSGGFSNFFLNNVLTSFSDNCAPTAHPFIGAFQLAFGCADIGINNETYFFRDRQLGPTSREDNCNVLIQINDPLGVCGTDPVANCQDFAVGPDPDGTYTLDANSLDNGSTDDRSVYTLVFDPATDRQESLVQDCTFNNVGNGQSFTAGQTGAVQTIRVRSVTSVSTTLHIYEGDNGSGIAGAIGTPAYSQAVELFASPTGAFTEMLLSTPFPVSAGSEYTFVLEGTTDLYYDCGTTPGYLGGRTMLNYVQWLGGTAEDYSFQVDIIGPVTQDFTADGVYPLTVYAVDDQGNVSAACATMFTLDQSLPVSWLSFGAHAGAKTVELQWETSNEPDNLGFHIERSAGGRAWSVIGEQAPLASNVYEHVDNAPLDGENHYRIRQTDFDGTVTYSPVEVVTFTGNQAELSVFPNPATDEFTVRIPAKFGEDAQVQLIDITGRTIQVPAYLTESGVHFEATQLARGVYLLRAVSKDGKVAETMRIVLQ